VDFGWGWQSTANPASIRRIRYVSGDQPPVAVVSATPQSGPAPLTVMFSSAGSYDPEGLPLSYAWTFGDSTTSTQINPVHVYTGSGQFAAQLAVSDGTTTVQSRLLNIAVGNPPQVTITSPLNGLVFRAGDEISFSGTATDPEDGPLPPTAYAWTVLFHHDSHVHPVMASVSGMTSGTFTVPTSGHDFSGTTSYEVILTATDSTGLQTASSVSIYPHKVNVTLTTAPINLNLNVDGINTATPYVKDTLTGFQHTLDAPSQTVGSTNYAFSSWSDGGAKTHTIVVGETASSVTATYQATTVTGFPASTTVLTGTLSSGTAASLASDDNVYYAVKSTTSGTRTATWYASFPGVPKGLTSLRVNYKGSNSRNCTQTVAIWNWTASAWVQLDSRTVGTTEVTINNLVPGGTLSNYVSGSAGSGEVRVRINCQTTANVTSRGDVMSIAYDVPVGPPPPDTTAPIRSNGTPSGVLAMGTTQANLALTTDEVAQCRYATTPGVPYASMTNSLTAAGTAHSAIVTGLSNGSSYSYFVRCSDPSGNANSDDFTISFSVSASAPTGLVAGYGFNEGSGTSAADTSGNNHHATLVGGVTWTTSAVSGKAIQLGGTNGYVSVTNPGMPTGDFTASAWVYPTSTSAWQTVMEMLTPSSVGWELDLEPGGRLTLWTNGALRFTTTASLAVNTWSYVTLRRQGSTWQVFINAVAQSPTGTDAIVFAFGSCPFYIGVDADSGCTGALNGYLQARIDEVRIYSRALSQTEIATDMNTPVN
jgi:PKD repeat protein